MGFEFSILDTGFTADLRALKDHPDINPQTKKNVQELAKKLNYKPNQSAFNLLQKESKIIGIIIPEIIHYFFSTVISGIEKIANEAGYHIIIAQSDESYHKEVDFVSTYFRTGQLIKKGAVQKVNLSFREFDI